MAIFSATFCQHAFAIKCNHKVFAQRKPTRDRHVCFSSSCQSFSLFSMCWAWASLNQSYSFNAIHYITLYVMLYTVVMWLPSLQVFRIPFRIHCMRIDLCCASVCVPIASHFSSSLFILTVRKLVEHISGNASVCSECGLIAFEIEDEVSH